MDRIDVRGLLDAPGSTRMLERAEPIDGLTSELARVPAEEPVEMRLRLESVVEGILVTGDVTAPVAFSCARCLQPGTRRIRADVTELFAEDASPDDEDAYPLAEGEIDLEPMVRDSLVLGFPFSPLCRPDCAGLCERCGGDRNLGECSCADEADPRWAALQALEIE